MITIKEVITQLEKLAPPPYQEDYDNNGLLVGNAEEEVRSILLTLDVTEDVIEEAKSKGCNLVIAHHPIIFKGLKRLTGSSYVDKTVIKAIKNDIAIYAIHTNLDNVENGVNYKIAGVIGLQNIRMLAPKKNLLKKLIVFIPLDATDKVLKAIYEAGAGNIGNYSECSFQLEGTGTFRPNEEANPTIGEPNKLEHVKEKRVEIIFPGYLEGKVLAALEKAHPYEEPAYDLNLLDNYFPKVGSGVMGELENAMDEKVFLAFLKEKMNLSCIRHTPLLGKKIKKVALCGGSGSFLLKNAVQQAADVFISSDFKYHEFFDAEGKILIADINHYEGEVFTKDLLFEYLNKKFINIAVALSNINTNPISYL